MHTTKLQVESQKNLKWVNVIKVFFLVILCFLMSMAKVIPCAMAEEVGLGHKTHRQAIDEEKFHATVEMVANSVRSLHDSVDLNPLLQSYQAALAGLRAFGENADYYPVLLTAAQRRSRTDKLGVVIHWLSLDYRSMPIFRFLSEDGEIIGETESRQYHWKPSPMEDAPPNYCRAELFIAVQMDGQDDVKEPVVGATAAYFHKQMPLKYVAAEFVLSDGSTRIQVIPVAGNP